jgi:flavin-dependent dehydrogenase
VRRAAALIVGGGPAGAASAITLARGGAMPILVERSPGERDVVCGGFLGWDAIAALKRLGLDPAALGARAIHRLRLVAGRRIVETELPRPAAGLSRRRLDAALLHLAEEAGAAVLRGRAVRALEGDDVRLDDGTEMAADALFLATGKHELRGAARATGRRKLSVGLRAALPADPALAAALAGTVELHLYQGGYAGLLVQEDGAVNLCLSVARDRMADAAAPHALFEELVREAPLLGERVGTPPGQWEAIAGVPYGWRARGGDGLYRVGDQAAVIASLAGDGIALALVSGMAAAHCHLAGIGADECQRAFSRKAARPVRMAEWLRHMAEHRRERAVMMRLAGVGGLAAWAALRTRVG